MVPRKTQARVANLITRLFNTGERFESEGRYLKKEALVLRKEANKIFRGLEDVGKN
jgi:hypothetical protein